MKIEDMKNKVICGNNIETLKRMPENSIDTIITDPPYGLSFMGKKWDYDVPGIETWQECLRVLKPGGTALIFAGSRTQHRMACNVEDSGFILKDCIMWLYGSGFPKATDISKQLDKGHEREVTGIGKAGAGMNKVKGFGQNTNKGGEVTKEWEEKDNAVTPEAKLWNGWKSHGLKPAYEPILVAIKPNEGSYAENALKHGVAGLNIDGGRIETDEVITNHSRGSESAISKGKYGDSSEQETHQTEGQKQGRFPANIILDEEAGQMLDGQSGSLKSGDNCKRTKEGAFLEHGGLGKAGDIQTTYGDKGGASRFFYCAKASKAERNAGCEGLEEKKVSDGREKEADNAYQRGKTLRSNTHPTVKPVKLMEYLCTLTKTPTGGIVLDPWAGSGTTGIACINTHRDYILIEREQEYCKIADNRLNNVIPSLF